MAPASCSFKLRALCVPALILRLFARRPRPRARDPRVLRGNQSPPKFELSREESRRECLHGGKVLELLGLQTLTLEKARSPERGTASSEGVRSERRNAALLAQVL